VSGPTLLLFASSVISPSPDAIRPGVLRKHYLEVAGRFLLVLGLLQLWKIGTDLFFGGGMNRMSVPDAVGMLVLPAASTMIGTERAD
jgi:hypothetical protein